MNEIKCPHCGEMFTIDESGYDAIVKQIRDDEFNKEISRRENAFAQEKESALKLANAEANNKHQQEIAELNSKIQSLMNKLESSEENKKTAVAQALTTKDAEIASLKSQLAIKDSEKKLALAEVESKKDKEISQKEQQIMALNSEIKTAEGQYKMQESALKEKYEGQLKDKDELIDYYKDFKARQSTKMVGESLEQHCEIEFNKLRATGFKNAYFEKDNDARSGSKGDYIYRELDENGVEIISIMFEMKNEMDDTASKHKNEDFFKELDKDRNEKKCEYAVLVTLLEADSELYNSGIVDVSHRYEKMYVIRPQFFIPMITLLRNAALNSLQYKQELAMVRNQNIDVTNFEQSLFDFKNDFQYNVDQAHKRFDEAIKGIDDTMKKLQKIRDALTKSDDQLRKANNKVEGVSIKKLTRGNPTMQAKFAELAENNK